MRDFQLPGRSPVLASTGMVATSHPLAASEALQVMKAGGNAADAAIAGAVLLGVCEPHMTGLGGDCFALVKSAGSEEVVALNGSGRAPSGRWAADLRAEGLTRIAPGHPSSVTVPGAVDGLWRLSDRFGRIGLDRCLAPAIAYFEAGVPVAPRVASDLARLTEGLTPAARRHFLKDGRPYRLGERFALPGQAVVLRRILKDGPKAFYEGEVADDILAALRAVGGTHTAEDFAATASDWAAPVSGEYRGRTLLEHPPNGQGATAILLANILAEFDIAGLDPMGAERLHLEAEATKLAYDARNRFLADPDSTTRLAAMLDPATGRRLAALIRADRAIEGPRALTEAVHKDTVLITAVDGDGMAVSLIYSIFASFGAGVASDRFGIMLHNRGSGFSLEEGHPNELAPGKRPMHTIIPGMMATAGRIDMAFGVMGGQYQAAGHAHVLSNLVDFGMDPQEAIDAPRVFAYEGELQVERGVPEATRARLADLGHRVVTPPLPIGGGQAIAIDHERGVLIGASDPRKDGLAIGY